MLTFFRRIRKSLLDGGRTSKYLLYAIGEIALVVIGILIALQINNWNSQRIANKNEQEFLTIIIEDLLQDFQKTSELLQRVKFRQGIHKELYFESSSGFTKKNSDPFSSEIVETTDPISDTWNNHKGSIETISDKGIRRDLNQYFSHYQVLLKYSGDLNNIILYEFRPFLKNNEIINLNTVFKSSSDRDDVDRFSFFHSDNLMAELGTKEFNMILVELFLGTQDVIQSLEILLEHNELLRFNLNAATG